MNAKDFEQSTIGKGLSMYGYIKLFGFIILLFILSISLLFGGYTMIKQSYIKRIQVSGTILKSPECVSKTKTKNNTITNCKYNVSYSIDSKIFYNSVDTFIKYKEGDNIIIFYNNSDSNDISLSSSNGSIKLGIILIIFGSLYIVLVIFLFRKRNDKTFTTYLGVYEAGSSISNRLD
jgi:hypothetical protein